jgi:AraC-like DNA-binding protein
MLIESRVRQYPKLRLTAHELARELGLSVTYFRTLFRVSYGMSVRAWLVDRRLARASILLNETNLRIGEIARELGYDSLSLFTRQFTAQHHLSPRRYRQQHGG